MGFLSLADHKRESSGHYTPKEGEQPNQQNTYKVTWADLPLNCPMPEMSLWNSHPKVYIPIHKSGTDKCPYCGAIYELQPPVPGEPAPFFRGDSEMEEAYYAALDKVTQDKAS